MNNKKIKKLKTTKILLQNTLQHAMFFEEIRRDHDPLDFAGALVNFSDPRIAIMPFGRHILDVTHAAKDLNRLMGAEGCRFRGGTLRHSRLFGELLPLIFQEARLIRQQTRGLESHLHVGEFELNRLKRMDRLVETLPLARVLDRAVDRGLGYAQRLARDPDPAAIEDCHRDLEAFAVLAEAILFGDHGIFEDQRAR